VHVFICIFIVQYPLQYKITDKLLIILISML